jgi:nucleotide-binding universal stress UspA family protein
MERIVVGVDGSDGGQRALRWAIAEARRRGAAVQVVHAWHTNYAAANPYLGLPETDLTRLEECEQRDLDHAVATEDTSGVDVMLLLVFQDAPHALLEAAKGADLLVVGTRGRGGVAGRLLGSVSQAVTRHARCPVVVVPATERAAA